MLAVLLIVAAVSGLALVGSSTGDNSSDDTTVMLSDQALESTKESDDDPYIPSEGFVTDDKGG